MLYLFKNKIKLENKITAEIYQKDKDRYTVVSGFTEGAPCCPYGNRHKWVGFDKKEQKFVRFTKSVFLKLVEQVENNCITNKKIKHHA